MKYVEHNQVKRQLELDINEMEIEEQHLNKKFEILKELYAEPESKPSPGKSPRNSNYFLPEKYSSPIQGKVSEKKMEVMPDTLDIEAGAFGVKPEKALKSIYVKAPEKSWKTNTLHEPIFNRKVDLEDMQNVYDDLMKLKTELDEAAYTNSNLSTQLETHFKGHFGIKSCSACKKRYTPLNSDPVRLVKREGLPVPSWTADLLLLQGVRR